MALCPLPARDRRAGSWPEDSVDPLRVEAEQLQPKLDIGAAVPRKTEGVFDGGEPVRVDSGGIAAHNGQAFRGSGGSVGGN